MQDSPTTGFHRLLTRWVNVEPSEIRAVVLSFLYFFFLLCGYYILRPMRDQMGIAGGVENLDWMFTGTFLATLAVVPLFGWAASRFPRRKLLPYVYLFFIANILVFYILFKSDVTHVWIARAFFIWLSVFNLFVVSVFWSFMVDIYSNPQARRLFGFIAAGGTAGALTGPAVTAVLVVPIGMDNLLLISVAFLGCAIVCIQKLGKWARTTRRSTEPEPNSLNSENEDPVAEKPMGGSMIAGVPLVFRSPYLLGICLLMLLFSTLSTFLYIQQGVIIRDSFSSAEDQTAVFAWMDFSVNGLTVLIQVFLTARIVRRLGLAWTLAFVPIGLAAGFLVLGWAPVLGVFIVVQVLRRAGNYSIMKPAREMLYVVLGKEEKYKAKNFIDTVVYRGGDAVSAWAHSGLEALGLTLAGVAFVAAPLAGLWAWVSFRLGRKNEALVSGLNLKGFISFSRSTRTRI